DHVLQHRVAHRAARPSDACGRPRPRDGGLTDETRSHSGARIDDRGWGRYVGIPLARLRNRERYTHTQARLEETSLSASIPVSERLARLGQRAAPEGV